MGRGQAGLGSSVHVGGWVGAERRWRRRNTTPQSQCVPVACKTDQAPGWLRRGDRSVTRPGTFVLFAEALKIKQAVARSGLPAVRTVHPLWTKASETPGG